jgi:hypothetical protein
MRSLLGSVLIASAVLLAASLACAQGPNSREMPEPPPLPLNRIRLPDEVDRNATPTARPTPAPALPVQFLQAPGQQPIGADGQKENPAAVALAQKDLEGLRAELTAAQAANQQDEDLKKRVELLQKQIEIQQKMIELLTDHVKKQPLAGSPVEKLQTQFATLESRSQQAARRDQEVAQAIDNLTEHMDADGRNGPRLPGTLKELYLPSRTNETPLSIYGTLIAGYELFPHQRGEGRFVFDGFEPVFLLQVNDHILFEAELEFHLDGVEVGYAQMDYIVNDWLTVVAGRYLAPIGFFNERLHPAWINKLPDFPLMNRVVSPSDFSLNGIQLRGASYLFGCPVKMEYSMYLANGVGAPDENSLTGFANLGGFTETTKRVNDAIAAGERVGFWLPECGLNAGFSTFFNRPYDQDAGPRMDLWGIDAGYHKGNWDVRFEYARMIQKSPAPMEPGPMPAEATDMEEVPAQLRIRRSGFYAQVAYRPYDACTPCLANTEAVFRYSRARFSGIDPAAIDLSAFESPVLVPLDRDQYTFGVNYYFTPSLIMKFAYEINQERHIDLRDNLFLAQLAWGF